MAGDFCEIEKVRVEGCEGGERGDGGIAGFLREGNCDQNVLKGADEGGEEGGEIRGSGCPFIALWVGSNNKCYFGSENNH